MDENMNLNEMGFRFALSIEDYFKPDEIKSSSKYVRWVFQLWRKENHLLTSKVLDYHVCTDEDYA